MRVNQSQTTKSDWNVHDVVILDASGSMDGGKYRAAKAGVQQELEQCKELGFSFSFIEFVQSDNIITHCLKSNPNKVSLRFNGATGYNTPLYKVIVDTIYSLINTKQDNDKFLIKILTDGQSNSGGTTAKECYQAIKKAEGLGFTVTFVAGKYDIEYIIRQIGIDESNTQTHDNTEQSITDAYVLTRSATVNYMKRLDEGEDVTLGFYSKILND